MEKYQKELDEFYKKNGWRYWSPFAILARLFEEGGEFARLVNHLYGEKKKKDTEKAQEMGEEIGDIIFTLICFANSNGINLDKAIRSSFDKMTDRDKDRFGKDDRK
ncbi:MAG: MazG nucleotide pyrophosphohydrolase domain-containing protein [Patescibacteria group bacterium]